jgi:hypothetical protein
MTAASNYTNTGGAASHLALSKSYLEKLRLSGGGPPFIKIGKAVRYKFGDLDAWFGAKVHGSMSTPPISDVDPIETLLEPGRMPR